ncbi:MAG: molybdopterin-dependent oxidoreductase, partial [Deltaproteobacteria bacterium]|nr:molybdopterin-dependent oxidoreductase [Deltaproteobacteria bacterium]
MKQQHKNDFMNGPESKDFNYDRRDFLKKMGLLGGGIIIYFTIGDAGKSMAQYGLGPAPDFNAFLRIGPNERVTCFIGKVDMGQGTITSFPQLVAEELDVAYDRVDMVMGDTDTCPWDIGTGGSMSIRVVGVQVRSAAAEAKEVLKLLAAEYLKCPVERLKTKDGVVFDTKNPDKKVTYGTLAKGAIIEKRLETKPPVTSPEAFKFIGKPYLHQDAYKKVTGMAQYAGDIRLPDMLYAGILRPPVHGALLKNVDLTEAKKIKGIQVIEDGNLVAVLHEAPDIAWMALGMIKAEFDLPGTSLNDKNIYEHLLKIPVQPHIMEKKGDIEEGAKLAKELIEETYVSAYVAHAPMETHTSLATIENSKITIWASTQSPFAIQRTVAEGMKLPADKVRVITPFVGGAFGGKLTVAIDSNPEALAAARLAHLPGRPVQVSFSRAEEFFYDTFRPAAVVKIKSGVDGSGKIVFWDYDVYMAGDGGAEVIYDIPHRMVNVYGTWMVPPPGAHPFRVGSWRAPGVPNNIHAKEMQISLMAAKAGVDPLEFRLKNLKDEKMIGVLKAAAEKFGYKPAKPVSGRGIGISCGIDVDTYVAHIGEIEIDKKTGEIRVKRVVCVYDMGLCI